MPRALAVADTTSRTPFTDRQTFRRARLKYPIGLYRVRIGLSNFCASPQHLCYFMARHVNYK
jgi:hypothetical protein